MHTLSPNPAQPNKYEHALQSVLVILQEYDYNKSFQVYGFGARIGTEPAQNNAFPINTDAPECAGVQGTHLDVEYINWNVSCNTIFFDVLVRRRSGRLP